MERDARAQQLAQVMAICRFRVCRDADLDELGSWVRTGRLGMTVRWRCCEAPWTSCAAES